MKRTFCPAWRGLAVALLLWPWGLGALAADQRQDLIRAGDLQLTLAKGPEGLQLASLRDERSGQELLAANALPLFSLTLRRVGATNQANLVADGGWRACSVASHGPTHELLWTHPVDEALTGISVTVIVSSEAASHALHWKLRVQNHSTNWSVWRVVFPELNLADLGTNGAVLFPRGPGEVQRGVWQRPFSYRGEYPSGWCSMQFLAAYREDDSPTGLYVGLHDPWGSTKDLTIEGDPAARVVRLKVDHPAPNMGLGGNDVAVEGEVVWQLLRGDWFDAALRYKSWAQRQARWWPRLGRDGRTDTPRWMRELNVWAMTSGAPGECVPAVKTFRDFLGQPTGFHWYSWHQIPFDNDYPHYFPAREGFSQGVAELQSAGVFVMPYINGRLWDSHDCGAQDYEFSRLALPAVTKQADGSPYLERYGSKETNGEPVALGVMCPATPLWQKTVSNIVLRLLGECGTSAVYIDQVAAAAPKLCLDPAHGHPLGGGHWWNEGYWRMLEAIRRAMPPGKVLTTECNGEPFIRWFDGYLTWHWQFQGQVPAFPAVYGGAIQMFGRAYRGGETKALALRMKAGQQLVFGEQLGWIEPALVNEKENAEFFRQVAGVRARFNHYFSAGEMARPPRLLGPVPTVRADWQWSGEWWVTTDAVLTGAWQMPKQHRMLMLFVNVSDQTVVSPVRFNAAENGFRARGFRVQRSAANQATSDWEKCSPSFERSVALPPRQVEAWELRW